MKEPAFDTGECDHKTCQDCLREYFWGVLTDNTYKDYTEIQCPGTDCDKRYLSQDVIPVIFTIEEGTDWWASALSSRAYINNKVKCPHFGCTGVFDAEDDHTKQCTFAECYQCHKGLCITCQTVWHPEEIKVRDNSLSLKETLRTAEMNKWCQCPFCDNLVERVAGCQSIYCRCGKYFCYNCGGKMEGYGRCLNNCSLADPTRLHQLRAQMFSHMNNADNT
ncbi:unnamed protein product [Mucor hiemalis]